MQTKPRKSDSCVSKLNASGGYQAEPVDMWGAGVVLFTLLVGSKSFRQGLAERILIFSLTNKTLRGTNQR